MEYIRPHGNMNRGTPIKLSIKYHGKMQSNIAFNVDVFSNDMVKDVVTLICERVVKRAEELKFICRGKDIQIADYKKTLAQMNYSDFESFIVAEKPSTQMPTSNVAKVRISSSLETLPAMVIAKDHFDIFFELLESSSGTDCDDIWDLIMQIPTCTTVLSQWLSLSCNKVVDILSLTFSHTTNIGRILYSLQILEMLIQPTFNITEMNAITTIQIGATKVAPQDLMNKWISLFVLKGGIYAILEVFKKLTYTLDENICKYGSYEISITGVTPALINNTLILTTKILRSVFVRTAVSDNPELIQLALSRVEMVGKFEQEKYEIKSRQIVNIDKQDVCLIGPILPSDKLSSNDQSHAMDEVVDSKPIDMLSMEWGWLLGIFASSQQSMKMLIREINLESTQNTLLLLMATMRKFTQIDYFYNNKSADLTKLKQDAILQISNNLLVIWSCIVTLEPSIIVSIKVEPQDSLTGLGRKRMRSTTPRHDASPTTAGSASSMVVTIDYILQETLGLATTDLELVSSKFKSECLSFGERLGKWTENAILSFLLFLSEVCIVKLQSPQISDNFREKIFWSLLAMRPPISLDGDFASITSLQPFFRLTSAILQGVQSSDFGKAIAPITISDDARLTSCLGILEELKASCKGLSVYSLEDSQSLVCGTFRLLISLAAGHDNVLAALIKENTIDFILNDCLCFHAKAGKQNYLCSDESSKSEAYSLLLLMCNWSEEVVGQVFNMLRELHHAVPSPGTFSYKPEKEKRSEIGYVGLKNMGSTCYMNR